MIPLQPPKKLTGIEQAKRISMEMNRPMVIVLACNFENDTLEMFSYGNDRDKCATAAKLGTVAHTAIIETIENLLT